MSEMLWPLKNRRKFGARSARHACERPPGWSRVATGSVAERGVPCGAAAGRGSSRAGSSASTLVSGSLTVGQLAWMPTQAKRHHPRRGLPQVLAVGWNEYHMLPFSLVYRDGFYLPFGQAHVFPGVKYKLIRERLRETRAA